MNATEVPETVIFSGLRRCFWSRNVGITNKTAVIGCIFVLKSQVWSLVRPSNRFISWSTGRVFVHGSPAASPCGAVTHSYSSIYFHAQKAHASHPSPLLLRKMRGDLAPSFSFSLHTLDQCGRFIHWSLIINLSYWPLLWASCCSKTWQTKWKHLK